MEKSNNNWSEASGDFIERASRALDLDTDKASRLEEGEALAEENPQSPLANHVLGHVRAALGEVDEALPCLRRAAEMAPECPEIAFTLAHAYSKGKQFGPAAAECKRALDVANPDDPRRHTVGSREHMADVGSAWVAAAKERLRGLLTDALAAMARERLNGMSDEEQRSFLTVRVEDLQAHCHSQEWLIELDDAINFATNTESWFYFLCPECNRAFLEANDFRSHIEDEHTRELKKLQSDLLKNVADKQTGFLESWISPKTNDIPPGSKSHQGNEIVRKIMDAVLYLDDRKAISVKLVDKLVDFTKGWLEKAAAIPKDLSCIASLDHAGLQVLGSFLQRLQTSSGYWPNERAFGGEHDRPDAVNVVIQIQDACVLSVDIDKIVSGRDAGSSNADALFSWLCLQVERLPSWASMRQVCIAEGTELLEKMGNMKDLLMKQVNLKSGLSNMNEDYFRTEASVDVEIFRLHSEVEHLKSKLVKACRFDYAALILPVMKAHLWHKLSRESPGKGLQGVDAHMKDQPIIAEKAEIASSSRIANISTDEGDTAACQNGDIEIQSLNMTLRSLWHLRHFSGWYKDTAQVIPHVGVAGNYCVICKLHQLFSAWDSKDDIRPTFVLRYMRTSFSEILNHANVSQKVETNIAVKITEIIFDMIHLSCTASAASCPTREMRYQTVTTSCCLDKKCTIHSLFGMLKNEENKYTSFVNLDASDLLNVEVKSFSEVIKAVTKRFNCDTENSGYSHPPRFFTTVFTQPSEKESHFDVSGMLVSIGAAPLDISFFCEGLHSEYKYIVLSAVFRTEDRDVCFAREQDKWCIYDDDTVKDADSWENVLDEYNQPHLYPKIIFFEQYSSTTES